MFAGLSDAIIRAAIYVVNLLPPSPFGVLYEAMEDDTIAQWLSFVNWFIPIGTFVGILESWLAAVAVYYIYQIVLRWIKVIE